MNNYNTNNFKDLIRAYLESGAGTEEDLVKLFTANLNDTSSELAAQKKAQQEEAKKIAIRNEMADDIMDDLYSFIAEYYPNVKIKEDPENGMAFDGTLLISLLDSLSNLKVAFNNFGGLEKIKELMDPFGAIDMFEGDRIGIHSSKPPKDKTCACDQKCKNKTGDSWYDVMQKFFDIYGL